jgi:Tfp pilus assembly protein PilO
MTVRDPSGIAPMASPAAALAGDRLAWQAQRALRGFGLTGTAALALALSCVVFHVASVRPLKKEVGRLRAELVQLRAAMPDAAAAAPLPPAQQLAAFRERLPASTEAPEVLRQLYRNAAAAGLALPRGDYRPQREPGSDIVRYRIELPLRGAYPDVRRFLDRTLRDHPALALDNLGFRKEAGTPLEAQMRLTLFAREGA